MATKDAKDLIRVGDLFSTYEELQLKINEYETTNYVKFYRRDARTVQSAEHRCLKKKLSDSITYYELRYCCISGGSKFKTRGCGKRDKQSLRIGCEAFIYIRATEDGQALVIKKVNDEHNHPVSKDLYDQLPQIRKLTEQGEDNEVGNSSRSSLVEIKKPRIRRRKTPAEHPSIKIRRVFNENDVPHMCHEHQVPHVHDINGQPEVSCSDERPIDDDQELLFRLDSGTCFIMNKLLKGDKVTLRDIDSVIRSLRWYRDQKVSENCQKDHSNQTQAAKVAEGCNMVESTTHSGRQSNVPACSCISTPKGRTRDKTDVTPTSRNTKGYRGREEWDEQTIQYNLPSVIIDTKPECVGMKTEVTVSDQCAQTYFEDEVDAEVDFDLSESETL